EKFYRAADARPGGTGLGLTICKRLIEAMGGNISISSKENEGSTFFFTLRMAAGAEANEDQHVHDASNANPLPSNKEIFFHHQLNILIVDDNIINQKVVAGFLDKLGLSYATAGTGKDVLDMIEREKFSAILMDLQLPDMSGIEITKHIRENTNDNIASIPVIAFTGNTAQEDVDTCKNVGMNDFATKPISFEKIVELMQKADGQMDFRWTMTTKTTIVDDGLSPLMRHRMAQESESNRLNASLQIKTELHDADHIDFSSIELDDDDDSFAVAVEQFEAMEKQDALGTQIQKPLGSLAEYGLDEVILKSLTKSLGLAQTIEILVGFYDKADELIAAAGSAFLEGNLPNLYARSHELKGMAANFGFSDLSRLCG
ncbi:MAG: response regulator, partial [Pseudomonadota bacterium]